MPAPSTTDMLRFLGYLAGPGPLGSLSLTTPQQREPPKSQSSQVPVGKPDLESLQAGNQTREYAVFQKRPLSRYVPHNTCDPSWNPCPYTGKDVLPSESSPARGKEE